MKVDEERVLGCRAGPDPNRALLFVWKKKTPHKKNRALLELMKQLTTSRLLLP